MTEPSDDTIASLQNFYARQAHLIDAAQHAQWADTFTPDGEFHSPTYGEPAIGREHLIGISKAFSQGAAREGERHHHLVQDLWVRRHDGAQAEVQAYLLIAGTHTETNATRLLRIVTIADELEKTATQWRVRRRKVTY